MKATHSRFTYFDGVPMRPKGAVYRAYYVDGLRQACVRIDSGASGSSQAEAREAAKRFPGAMPVDASAPRTASTADPMSAAPPKSAARLALEKLYQTCFDQGVKFADADALAEKVGIEQATTLIRERGPNAGFASMASRFWADRGQTTAPLTYRPAPVEFGGERSAEVFKRRSQATTEPVRVRESADFGTPAYAESIYNSRNIGCRALGEP